MIFPAVAVVRSRSRGGSTVNNHAFWPLFLCAAHVFAAEVPLVARDVNFVVDAPRAVGAEDLDRDGDIDLLSVSARDNRVVWYENDGDSVRPAFRPHVLSSTSETEPVAVRAADLNNDGHWDILVADKLGLAWYESNGAVRPTFTRRSLAAVSNTDSVDAADLDGDGDTDIMTDEGWYDHTGGVLPSFAFRTYPDVQAPGSCVHVADVDGDGDPDVVRGAEGAPHLVWFENTTQAPMSLTTHVLTNETGLPVALTVADLNRDGRADLLVLSQEGAVAWYPGNAVEPSGFGVPQTIGHLRQPSAVAVTDVDSDQDLDVAVTAAEDGTLVVFTNGGGALPAFMLRTIAANLPGACAVVAADLDDNGRTDLVAASEHADRVDWYENGGGVPVQFEPLPVTSGAGTVHEIAAADLDQDGDLDLLSASDTDGRVAWYENRGAWFAAHWVATGATGAIEVRTADLDGDGDLDVLAAPRDAVGLPWFSNDGRTPPRFTVQWISRTLENPMSVWPADVDGDGDTDVVTATRGTRRIAWHENTGGVPLAFVSRDVAGHTGREVVVRAGDLDGDRDTDLMAVFADLLGTGQLVWYTNNGARPPAFSTRLIDNRQRITATLVDLNLDGHLDIISSWTADVTWYRNNGATPPLFLQTRITDRGSTSNAVGDLDGDGDLDVLTALGRDVLWHDNQGGSVPAFVARTISATAQGARSILAADVDRDGDTDVVLATQDDGRIVWYENRSVILRPSTVRLR